MFEEVRRKDRLLEPERALELLQEGEYGFLSMGAGENGYAYGIPINYAYDEEQQTLYFHCAQEGHKIRNMKKNEKVSFCVVGNTQPIASKFTTAYESVIVFGKVNLNLSDEEKRRALRLLVSKYCKGYEEVGEKYMDKSWSRTKTFKVAIEHMTAKAKKMTVGGD